MKNSDKRSFTLIELLVVIAIIAILAGLLLPALNRSLISARKTSCAGNLKQLNIAAMMYIKDFNEYLPNNYNPYYHERIMPYLGSTKILTECRTVNAPQSYDHSAWGGDHGTYNMSYGASRWSLDVSNKHQKISRVSRPGEKIIFGDSRTYKQSGSTGAKSNNAAIINYSGDYAPDFRHGETANFVFFDGHVRNLKNILSTEKSGYVYFWAHFVGISELFSNTDPGFYDQYLIGGL